MADRTDRTSPALKPNYLYAVLSVSLVLFLVGFFGLVILEAQQLVKFSRERINIMAELTNAADQIVIDSLTRVISKEPYVRAGSIEFVGKEEGLEILEEELGTEFSELDMANPLYNMLQFNVKAEYMVPDTLELIRQRLKTSPYISDVYYQESLVDLVAKNIRKVGWFALGTGIFFVFIAFTLIHNTIRLALYANRFLIKNMELVGASWDFISRPFITRSIWQGLLSGLIAVALLGGVQWLFQRELPEINEIVSWPLLAALFGGLILFGILITMISTYYVVNKYLKMRVDDLY